MITIAIQAGGRSSRMGRDKALIPLAGRPLIEHLLERVEGLAGEVLITTNRPEEYAYLGVRLAEDEHPGAGALEGLRTALHAARGEHVLVLACDMPFISRPLVEHLLHIALGYDVVVPRRGADYEPLHAVYAREPCLAAVEQALRRGHRRVISFFPRVRVREVGQKTLERLDPEGLSFFNVNTSEELMEAERLLAGR